jgi:hypothetical protein
MKYVTFLLNIGPTSDRLHAERLIRTQLTLEYGGFIQSYNRKTYTAFLFLCNNPRTEIRNTQIGIYSGRNQTARLAYDTRL